MIIANWRWTKNIELQILEQIKGLYPVVHICTGSSLVGDVRLDRWYDPSKPSANVRGDMCTLPFKSGCAAAVVCDPPYNEKRYGKQFPLLLSELERITKPTGKILLLFKNIPQFRCCEIVGIWLHPAGIDKGAYPIYKVLSESIKTNGQIEDYM